MDTKVHNIDVAKIRKKPELTKRFINKKKNFSFCIFFVYLQVLSSPHTDVKN